MTDLTCSYQINSVEVKLQGQTKDGRHVQEVLTIGNKHVTAKRRLPLKPLIDTGRMMGGNR